MAIDIIDHRTERQGSAPLARRFWIASRSLQGTSAEPYLQGRGLSTPWTGLRFHPRTPIGRGAAVVFRPALIRGVRDESGIVAIHRIALDPNIGGKTSDLQSPKLTLGLPERGGVPLCKAGRMLRVAEGIETATSAARMLDIPVWVALESERFSSGGDLFCDQVNEVWPNRAIIDALAPALLEASLARRGKAKAMRSLTAPARHGGRGANPYGLAELGGFIARL